MTAAKRSVLAGLPVRWLGTVPFADAVAENLAAPTADRGAEIVAFEPSAPVLTLGRRTSTAKGRASLADTLALCESRGIGVLAADRGGQATLHLPGQLVWFLALPPPIPPVRSLVCDLLTAARSLASERGWDVVVRTDHDAGLWADTAKLASVGLRIRDRWVLHGMSVNVAIDPALAHGLQLCGHRDREFASISPQCDVEDVSAAVCSASHSVARYAGALAHASGRTHART